MSRLSFTSLHLLFWACICLKVSVGQKDQKLVSLAPLASNLSSVSGFSSGGAKALQFYLSHSSRLRGVGVASGLMYQCGYGKVTEVGKLLQCVSATMNYNNMLEKIHTEIADGLLDPLSGLKSQRQYVHHGSNDPLVSDKEGDTIAKFFRAYSSSANVLYNHSASSHGLPTEKCGSQCPSKFPPSRYGCLACGWNAAYSILNHIYGNTLKYPTDPTLTQCSPPSNTFDGLYTFDQSEFFPEGYEKSINMATTGYIYISDTCQLNPSLCTLHIHFHGCGEIASSPLVYTEYIKCSGVMAVAKENNIIVIFPQANLSLESISTALQCWDFVGYTGANFGNKRGPQIRAVKGMMDRVLGVGGLGLNSLE